MLSLLVGMIKIKKRERDVAYLSFSVFTVFGFLRLRDFGFSALGLHRLGLFPESEYPTYTFLDGSVGQRY